MKKFLMLGIALFVVGMMATDSAVAGLTINVAEMGIGKFHRKDNTVHNYGNQNSWNVFVLGDGVSTTSPKPMIIENQDSSFTIYFSTLQDLLESIVKLSKDKHELVSNININAHGMPGGTWFPKNKADMNSFNCMGWVQASRAPDEENYDQYYSAIPKQDIMDFRRISQDTRSSFGCVVGLKEWKEIVGVVPDFKKVLADDAQIHFLSCIVGLGPRGDMFTKGLAQLLFTNEKQRVETSLQYGLGDWSMPEGMGFWDYQNDEQLDHDNAIYPVDRNDREQMQKGTIRVGSLKNNEAVSGLIDGVDFMFLNTDTREPTLSTDKPRFSKSLMNTPLPSVVRIPGTHQIVFLQE